MQKGLTRSESYQEKYLTLHAAVIDLYTTWMNDVKKLGVRDTFEEPDHSNSTQIISSIKNMLIAFTPNKSGREYMYLSGLANKFWAKYFNHDPNLKSRPREIFSRLEDILRKNQEEITSLKRTINKLLIDKKGLTVNFEKLKVCLFTKFGN